MRSSLVIEDAETDAAHAAVRDLLWAFRDWLDERYEGETQLIERYYSRAAFAGLLADLPRLHARPGGRVLLARLPDGTPAGCCMYAALEPGIVELKRMYVAELARGRGAGRALVEAAILRAREDGYRTMRLDTGYRHDEAQALYLACGFVRRGSYHEVDPDWEGKLLFFERSI